VRFSNAILSVFALLWGFLQAPFDHIHPEDLDHSMTSGPVHVHGHKASTGHGPFIAPRTDDDDEIDVLWSVATSADVVVHPSAELDERVSVSSPARSVVAVVIPQLARGHDPPKLSRKIPRAPPV